jgi:hypothetical protein
MEINAIGLKAFLLSFLILIFSSITSFAIYPETFLAQNDAFLLTWLFSGMLADIILSRWSKSHCGSLTMIFFGFHSLLTVLITIHLINIRTSRKHQ